MVATGMIAVLFNTTPSAAVADEGQVDQKDRAMVTDVIP